MPAAPPSLSSKVISPGHLCLATLRLFFSLTHLIPCTLSFSYGGLHDFFYCAFAFLSFRPGYGRLEAVEHLLQVGASVHARDDGGLIPLHNACSFGHAEVKERFYYYLREL